MSTMSLPDKSSSDGEGAQGAERRLQCERGDDASREGGGGE
jgi:hypothetical protein